MREVKYLKLLHGSPHGMKNKYRRGKENHHTGVSEEHLGLITLTGPETSFISMTRKSRELIMSEEVLIAVFQSKKQPLHFLEHRRK